LKVKFADNISTRALFSTNIPIVYIYMAYGTRSFIVVT